MCWVNEFRGRFVRLLDPAKQAMGGAGRVRFFDGIGPNDYIRGSVANVTVTATPACPSLRLWAMLLLGFGGLGYAG
jgi:hypothetical protein